MCSNDTASAAAQGGILSVPTVHHRDCWETYESVAQDAAKRVARPTHSTAAQKKGVPMTPLFTSIVDCRFALRQLLASSQAAK